MAWDLAEVAALAKRWEAACSSGDPDAIVALVAEDAVIWFNYERVELNRAAYRALLVKGREQLPKPEYRDWRVMLHPDGFVEQATLEGETSTGRMSVPFLLVAKVKSGRITRIEEYFDSTLLKS